eukprot:jgi/Chrpa1/17294/Chrysochromulina_OHIO_Genome00020648-RA
MSRQYNMYNVQLSEFWKQRIGKETMHNAPYMFGDEEYPDDLVSEASYKSRDPRFALPTQIDELQKKLEEETKKRMEVEAMLAEVQKGKRVAM